MADAVEEEEGAQTGGLRPFWSGAITFGLVTVPVALHTATRPRGVALKMIGPDEAPIRRRYVCSKDERPLDADDIVRGFEIEKGRFIVVTDEELEAIEPRKSREIDLRLFVDLDDIDPMYFERAYYLVPAGGANKAYRLLAEVMERRKQAGIATFVMRAKEYLVAIIAENGILRAETLRFEDELRTPEDVGLPKIVKPAAADVRKLEAEIAKRAKKLDPRELLDDSTRRIEKLVKEKEKKKEDVVRLAEPEIGEEEGGEVVDLLAVLSRSLGGTAAKRKPAARARKARAKGGTAKRRGPPPANRQPPTANRQLS
jgi:DNA end-binding protein Ku